MKTIAAFGIAVAALVTSVASADAPNPVLWRAVDDSYQSFESAVPQVKLRSWDGMSGVIHYSMRLDGGSTCHVSARSDVVVECGSDELSYVLVCTGRRQCTLSRN